MIKLTKLSDLQVQALQEVLPERVKNATATTVELQVVNAGVALEMLQARMADMTDRRHHPYASLHAVVRKLKKAAGADAPAAPSESTGEAPVATEGPSQETIQTALDQLQAEMESPEFAAALEAIADDHPVKVQLDDEIAKLRDESARLDDDMTKVQAEYDKAWARTRRYEIDNVPPQVAAAADKCSEQVVRLLEQQKLISEKLNQLTAPAELERRLQDVNVKTQRIERIKTMAAKQPKKQTAREMGVPEEYLSDSGNFKPGLDARYKSDLVNSALGIKDKKALMTFTPEDAETRLQIRGWTGFLTRKREILAAKPAKKAAAKKTTKGTTKASAEVKPDPKPKKTAKRRGGRLQSKAGAAS